MRHDVVEEYLRLLLEREQRKRQGGSRMGLIERDRIAEALAEAAFTGQLPALEDEGTGAVERARVVVDFVLDAANHRGAVEAGRALAKWTQHLPTCARATTTADDCTCGLQEAWLALERFGGQ